MTDCILCEMRTEELQNKENSLFKSVGEGGGFSAPCSRYVLPLTNPHGAVAY